MFAEWWRRLWYLLNRRRMDAALRTELEAHREMLGEPARFGNVERIREDAHDAWGFRAVDDLGRDIRLAARGLRRSPVFTALVCISIGLSLAITVMTAVVTAAYLVRPLPYAHGERIYRVRYAPPGPWEPAGLSGLDWNALGDVVEAAITAAGDTAYVAEGAGFSAPYRLLRVSSGFIDGLGVRADRGRVLSAADYREEPMPAMIGHRLWREQFGADPAIVGREFQVEVEARQRRLESFRVVGVLPDGFWFGGDSRDLVDLVAPLGTPARTYRVRLRAGVPVDVAESRINEAVRQVASDLPADWSGVTLESARELYVADVRPVLGGAMVACGLILAIALANTAVLVLLRLSRREKEIAVRLTLGAGRGRIARMLMIESVLLVAMASAGGILVAHLALTFWDAEIARQLGRPAPGGLEDIALGADTVPVILAGVLLGVVVTGVLPLAARAAGWRRNIASALRRDQRTASEDRGGRRWRLTLVTIQVAGSLTLLIGGGLTAQSLFNMIRTDFGVRTEGLVRVSVDFPSSADPDPRAVAARHQRLTDALTWIAGQTVPRFGWPQFYETPKQPVGTDGAGIGTIEIGVVPVGSAYFETLEIPLLEGRLFDDTDRFDATPTAVVSRSAAVRLWPGLSPLGRQVEVADRDISGKQIRNRRTVVGVVADVRQEYGDRDLADVYVPIEQAEPSRYGWFYMPLGEAGPIWEPELRRIVTSIDPRASVRVAVPLPEEAARLWTSPRFMAGLIASLAIVSALLAVAGIYGVTAFSLEQRSRDIAIRWALGATGTAMARSLLAESAAIVAVGIAGGLAGAGLVARVLASQLHGLEPFDLPTFAAGAIVMAAVALCAAALPALRAATSNHLRLLGDSQP